MLRPTLFIKVILSNIFWFFTRIVIIAALSFSLILLAKRNDFVQSGYSALVDFSQNNPQLFGIVLGAFLASVFGLVTQMFLDWNKQNKSIIRSANILLSVCFNFENEPTWGRI